MAAHNPYQNPNPFQQGGPPPQQNFQAFGNNQNLNNQNNPAPRGRGGRGNFRGRGRGRGRGNQGNNNNNNNANPAPPPAPGNGPNIAAPIAVDAKAKPQPKALSTTPSQYKDDKMWQDFEAEGFDGLAPYTPRRFFATTFEGLVGLIDRCYDALNVSDPTFTKYISRSMFSYYIWQHVYVRIIEIKKHTGDETHDENRYYEFMKNRNYPVPEPIEEYLKSVGTTKDHTGIEYRMVFPAWPNDDGHFGQIDEDTHFLYESMAAPIVTSGRMVADLEYTMNPNVNRTWDLDPTIAPNDMNAGLPTKNLIGWAPAVTLTPEQRQILESGGVDNNSIHPDLPKFELNRALFENISDKVSKLEAKVKLGTITSGSVFGSAAQLQWQVRDPEENIYFDRLHQYSNGTVRVNSSHLEDKRLTIGALICAFRVRKIAVSRLRCYACYDYNGYTQVPNAWHISRNNIFDLGDVGRLNQDDFRSAYTNKDPIRTTWVRKMLKEKTTN